jgi:hypothetical protein
MSNPLEAIKCAKCGKAAEVIKGWFFVDVVQGGDCGAYYCSRACLVEGMAPEVTKAIVVGQWIDPPIPSGHTAVEVKRFIPTAEEEERMCQ